MRRIASMLLTAWAVSSIIGPPPAAAQRDGAGAGTTEVPRSPTASVLDRYDVDDDGKLSPEEKATLRRDLREKVAPMRAATLREFDWNRNGRLDADELVARKQARVQRHARAEARALAKFDANRDGVLDAAEAQQRKAARDAWFAHKKSQVVARNDLDQDGVLNAAEKAAMRSRLEAGRAAALERYDTDRNGRLSDAERTTAVAAERSRLASHEAGSSRLRGEGVKLIAAVGGEVGAEGGAARLVVPAGALAADGPVVVTDAGVLEHGHGGRELVRVVDVAWGGEALRKPATLEIATVTGPGGRPIGELVAGRWTGQGWQEVRGSVVDGRLATPITEAGRYALMEPAPIGAATLSNVRVISATTTRTGRGAEVVFALGRAGAVTVKVYDTAGRVVRTVVAGAGFAAGEQVVRWDGGGPDGRAVAKGVYLLSVEAFGQKVTRKLPMVR